MSIKSKMTAIADAIRSKTGKKNTLTLDDMANEISNLTTEELINHVDIPDYVRTEVLNLENKIKNVRTDDSIVFLAMSDQHHYGKQADTDQYTDADGVQTDIGNIHSSMASKILAYGMKFDFMAFLGDACWGNFKTTSTVLQYQIKDIFDLLAESHKDIPCFHAIGNHDTGIYYHNQMIKDGYTGVYTETGEYLYNTFTALSASEDTVISGQANGGYCYRDFEDKKIRVYLLNTSEKLVSAQKDGATLGTQRLWFANSLINLNETRGAEWGFIVLSHYPADYGNAMPLSELLKAYVEGTSITINDPATEYNAGDGTNITINFNGKNASKFIAQFHGHIHNFLTSKLYSYATGKGVQYDAWRIATPNGQYNRGNDYTTVGSYTDINFFDSTLEAGDYANIPNTARETSFVVNVINPSEQKIYSFCYGAGYDRVVGYSKSVYYGVAPSLSNATLSNDAISVEEGKEYTTNVNPNEGYRLKKVTVLMGGVDITSTAYANGVITIAEVTGNISITVNTRLITSYTNQIEFSTDINGNIYNEVGYKSGIYVNSSGTETDRSGSYTTGFIPCGSGGSYVVRLRGITFNSKASDKSYYRITMYDADKKFLAQINAGSTGAVYQPNIADDGTWVSFSFLYGVGSTDITNMKYFRMSAGYIDDNSVITVNEEIK